MLEITGEYLPLDDASPKATRWQKILSWFRPVKVTTITHGADYVRYLTFETTYELKRGKWTWQKKHSRLIASEDLREYQARTRGIPYEEAMRLADEVAERRKGLMQRLHDEPSGVSPRREETP